MNAPKAFYTSADWNLYYEKLISIWFSSESSPTKIEKKKKIVLLNYFRVDQIYKSQNLRLLTNLMFKIIEFCKNIKPANEKYCRYFSKIIWWALIWKFPKFQNPQMKPSGSSTKKMKCQQLVCKKSWTSTVGGCYTQITLNPLQKLLRIQSQI